MNPAQAGVEAIGPGAAGAGTLDTRPPGERYYRHPGDVVRLVVFGIALVALVLFVEVATGTSDGLSADLGDAAASMPQAVRELSFALVQVAAIVVPAGVIAALLVRRRWRRLSIVVLAAGAGWGFVALLNQLTDLSVRLPDAIERGTWLASTRFPTTGYVGAAAAVATAGKPWPTRQWRRATDAAIVCLAAVMALAGSAGVPQLLLVLAAGAFVGAAILVGIGAPNRRPAPVTVAAALRQTGIDVVDLTLLRVAGGRSQLYRAETLDGDTVFTKVYSRDSRDADLLYRGYRMLVLREPGDDWPAWSLSREVEHESLLLVLARRAGVLCPAFTALSAMPDGSMALAMEDVDGVPLDSLDASQLTDELLDALWHQVRTLHGANLAHRSLRAGNVLVSEGRPVIVDFGFGTAAPDNRLRAIDRAELMASLAPLVGAQRTVAAAARTLEPGELSEAVRFLQPLALSASTRARVSKSLLQEMRAGIAATTGDEPPALEHLVRVRPKTLIMIATMAGAFYVLLPQLANVDDSVRALRSANWAWMVGCVVTSFLTYIASAIGMAGGVSHPLPAIPTLEVQFASSFINRVTPANVGGMALNVRFMQKAGIEPAEAVTGMGLNLAAGGIVHFFFLFVFLAWAGHTGGDGFSLPGSSKLLVGIVVILVIAGVLVATRWGRTIFRRHVLRFLRQALASAALLARSPGRMAALFGGSAGVTLAYAASLACAVYAFDGGLSFAQIGAVYLGSSIIAAAAPTPGGLGAMEAALVAGFTAVGMDPALAVATVLSYRLATYWLPILPGWLSFQDLERRNII